MRKLDSIQTQTGKINLFQDENGKLWIQQNNLTVALGYNKFLSRNKKRGSGLGKFLNGNIVKKYGNLNLLDMEKIVKFVLPEFLKGFFRELNGQPSRKQFFSKAPEEIYHNAKRVLEILKERIMSYDENSLEARKGALGEKIAKEQLERHNCQPTRPEDAFRSGASTVDFSCIDGDGERFFVEVKTQIARPYGTENAPCYSFPKSRIEAYKKYSEEKNGYVDIVVIDPSTGFGYLALLNALERETYIDARKYPFDKNVETLGGEFHYWHRNQFNNTFPIPYDDLVELRKLFNLDEPQIEDTKETKTEIPAPSLSEKSLVEKLAAFVNVGKTDLVQAVLELRQKKFDREQEQMKELLI